VTSKIHSDISPTPKFYKESKNVKFDPNFRPFDALCFEVKQCIENVKLGPGGGAPMSDLCFELSVRPFLS